MTLEFPIHITLTFIYTDKECKWQILLLIYPYTSPALPSHQYIYTELAPKVVGNGFCSSVVENWSSNQEDAGSIPSRKALELHFSQLVPVWVL